MEERDLLCGQQAKDRMHLGHRPSSARAHRPTLRLNLGAHRPLSLEDAAEALSKGCVLRGSQNQALFNETVSAYSRFLAPYITVPDLSSAVFQNKKEAEPQCILGYVGHKGFICSLQIQEMKAAFVGPHLRESLKWDRTLTGCSQ